MKRALLALAVGLSLAIAPSAAVATHPTGEVPENVLEFTQNKLVDQIKNMQGPVDFSGDITPGVVTRIHLFSDEFQQGERGAEVTVSLDEWIVPILAEGEPVGTASVWIENSAASLSGADKDAALAHALGTLSTGHTLIHYPQADEYYSLNGRQISPLSESARRFVGATLSTEDLQQRLLVRVSAAEAGVDLQQGDLVGGPSPTTQSNGFDINWWVILSVTTGGGLFILAGAWFWKRRLKL